VLEAFRRWRSGLARTTLSNARIFLRHHDGGIDQFGLADRLRRHLKRAGLTRSQIDGYERQVRSLAEANLGELAPLPEPIPEPASTSR